MRFTYDAAGNRIARTTSEGTTYFLVDPNMPYAQVLEETGTGGTKVYAYGNDLLNMQGPEGTRWFVYDGLGSTRALTDQAGTLTDEYTYEAFGSLIHRTGVTANEFLFTGEQREPGLGMYYLRARYYDPVVGRFSTRDPFTSFLQSSPYRYCGNNPVNDVDPSGHVSLIELMTSMNMQAILFRAAVGGAVGYGISVVDALLGGADIRKALQEAMVPAGIGAVGFALSPVSIIRKILITVGLVGGAEAVAESIEQGKGKQALLRVALLIVTVWGFKNDLQNIIRNNWLSKVPDYMGEETTGILVYRAGSKTFVSGFKKMTGKLPTGTPGYDLVTMSHVEGQVAAFMRENGITEAILFINQEPCIYEVPYPDGTVSIKGCGVYLKRWLPAGTKLTIVVKGGKTMLIIGED